MNTLQRTKPGEKHNGTEEPYRRQDLRGIRGLRKNNGGTLPPQASLLRSATLPKNDQTQEIRLDNE